MTQVTSSTGAPPTGICAGPAVPSRWPLIDAFLACLRRVFSCNEAPPATPRTHMHTRASTSMQAPTPAPRSFGTFGAGFEMQYTNNAMKTLLAAGSVVHRSLANHELNTNGPMETNARNNIENFALLYCVAVEIKGQTAELTEIGRAYVKLLAGGCGMGSMRQPHAAAFDKRLDLQEKLLLASGAISDTPGEGRQALLEKVAGSVDAFVISNANALGVAAQVRSGRSLAQMMDPGTAPIWEGLRDASRDTDPFYNIVHQIRISVKAPQLIGNYSDATAAARQSAAPAPSPEPGVTPSISPSSTPPTPPMALPPMPAPRQSPATPASIIGSVQVNDSSTHIRNKNINFYPGGDKSFGAADRDDDAGSSTWWGPGDAHGRSGRTDKSDRSDVGDFSDAGDKMSSNASDADFGKFSRDKRRAAPPKPHAAPAATLPHRPASGKASAWTRPVISTIGSRNRQYAGKVTLQEPVPSHPLRAPAAVSLAVPDSGRGVIREGWVRLDAIDKNGTGSTRWRSVTGSQAQVDLTRNLRLEGRERTGGRSVGHSHRGSNSAERLSADHFINPRSGTRH